MEVEEGSPGANPGDDLEDPREATPTMSVSLDLDRLRRQWRKRRRPGGEGHDITTFHAASVKVLAAP